MGVDTAAFKLRGPFLTDGTYLGYKIDESDDNFGPLWSKIEEASATNNVVDAIKEWKTAGKPLSKNLMTNVVLKMCAHSWYVQAHKLVRWVDKDQLFKLDEEVHQVLRLDILQQSGNGDRVISRFHKIAVKTEACYLLMLEGCGRKFERAEEVMKQLQESRRMTSARAYTVLFKMYTRLGMAQKAVAKLEEAEASGFSPDAAMYWDLFCHKSTVFGNREWVMAKIEAALDKGMITENTSSTSTSRRYVLRLNAALGRRAAVDSSWAGMLATPPLVLNDYLAAMGAYDLLGEIERVEAISSEVRRLLGDTVAPPYQHNIVLYRMYTRHGMLDKAMALVDVMSKQKHHFEQCSLLVEALLRQGKLEDASSWFRDYLGRGAAARHPVGMVVATARRLIDEFGRKRNVEGAETVVAASEFVRDGGIYKSLIKAYLVAGRGNAGIEGRMRDASVTVDDEMRMLLSKLSVLQ